MYGLPDLRRTPATRDPVGRIVIRPLSNMLPLRSDQRRRCHLFLCQNWIPCITTPHQFRSDGRSRRLLNVYLQPKTDAIERVLWYASGLARHQSPPSADSLPKGARNSVSERNPFGLRDRRARQHVCRYNFVRHMRRAVLRHNPGIAWDDGIYVS